MTASNPYQNLEYGAFLKALERIHKEFGLPVDISVLPPDVVSDFLEQEKIQPVAPEVILERARLAGNLLVTEVLRGAAPQNLRKGKKALQAEAPLPVADNIIICGGVKEFHLHCDGKIYLLNSRQVQKLSKRLVEQNVIKVRKVNKISFDKAVTLGELLAGITKK